MNRSENHLITILHEKSTKYKLMLQISLHPEEFTHDEIRVPNGSDKSDDYVFSLKELKKEMLRL